MPSYVIQGRGYSNNQRRILTDRVFHQPLVPPPGVPSGIQSADHYWSASRQIIPYMRSASATATALGRYDLFALAGNPGAGTAVASGTPGNTPVAGASGYPTINTFTGSLGYLTRVAYGCNVTGKIELWDKLWQIGTNASGTAITGLAPSWSTRVPTDPVKNAPNYIGIKAFAVQTSAATPGNTNTLTFTYTNQAGTTGRSAGSGSMSTSWTQYQMVEIPLAAGDSGIQSIATVTPGGGGTDTFNLVVARRLWMGRVRAANDYGIESLSQVGMPFISQQAALWVTFTPDSTSTGLPELMLEISNY